MLERSDAPEQPPAAPPVAPVRQRVRITFARGENARYVGHLDMVRTWERIIRRADLPVETRRG